VVAVTTYPGYVDVSRYIMQGYTVMAREVLVQLGRERTRIVIVEPAVEPAVEMLRQGAGLDSPVRTQPSGAAGFAGLVAASLEPTLAGPLGPGKENRVLIVGSEGPA